MVRVVLIVIQNIFWVWGEFILFFEVIELIISDFEFDDVMKKIIIKIILIREVIVVYGS